MNVISVDGSETDAGPAWLEPTSGETLSGEERLGNLGLNLLDIRRWSFSDLRTNVVRGVLAEFLVARAVGDPSPLRQAWDDFDVTTRSGVRVEVKSSAHLQSWRQRKVSRIGFRGLTGRPWDDELADHGPERELRADVYVFAIQTATEHALYDPLDLAQWEFRVMSAARLREHAYRSVGKSYLDRHARESVPLERLAQAIDKAHRENASASSPKQTA